VSSLRRTGVQLETRGRLKLASRGDRGPIFACPSGRPVAPALIVPVARGASFRRSVKCDDAHQRRARRLVVDSRSADRRCVFPSARTANRRIAALGLLAALAGPHAARDGAAGVAPGPWVDGPLPPRALATHATRHWLVRDDAQGAGGKGAWAGRGIDYQLGGSYRALRVRCSLSRWRGVLSATGVVAVLAGAGSAASPGASLAGRFRRALVELDLGPSTHALGAGRRGCGCRAARRGQRARAVRRRGRAASRSASRHRRPTRGFAAGSGYRLGAVYAERMGIDFVGVTFGWSLDFASAGEGGRRLSREGDDHAADLTPWRTRGASSPGRSGAMIGDRGDDGPADSEDVVTKAPEVSGTSSRRRRSAGPGRCRSLHGALHSVRRDASVYAAYDASSTARSAEAPPRGPGTSAGPARMRARRRRSPSSTTHVLASTTSVCTRADLHRHPFVDGLTVREWLAGGPQLARGVEVYRDAGRVCAAHRAASFTGTSSPTTCWWTATGGAGHRFGWCAPRSTRRGLKLSPTSWRHVALGGARRSPVPPAAARELGGAPTEPGLPQPAPRRGFCDGPRHALAETEFDADLPAVASRPGARRWSRRSPARRHLGRRPTWRRAARGRARRRAQRPVRLLRVAGRVYGERPFVAASRLELLDSIERGGCT